MMKRASILAVIALASIAAPADSFQAKEMVAWAKSWEAALEEAQVRNVPIFITIQQDENPGSTAMEGHFRDASFIAASRKVVCLVANGQVLHGTRELMVDKKKTPMCKAYDGMLCEEHLACNSVAGEFFKGTFDIPAQVWCKPDGKEMFKHTGPNGTGQQSAAELLRDMERALGLVPGVHLSRKDYAEAQKLLVDGQLLFEKGEYKKAIDCFKKLKESKSAKFQAKGEEALKAIEEAGNAMVDNAKEMAATDPKKAKEAKDILNKVAKEFKGFPCSTKAEEALKTIK